MGRGPQQMTDFRWSKYQTRIHQPTTNLAFLDFKMPGLHFLKGVINLEVHCSRLSGVKPQRWNIGIIDEANSSLELLQMTAVMADHHQCIALLLPPYFTRHW
jgi:hypothetical protein